MRHRTGVRIGEALDSVLQHFEGGARLRESLAVAHWADVVGPQAAAASEAEFVRDGVLFVRTKSSVWSHELTLLKEHILTELNRRIRRPLIRDIRYRARGLSRRAAEAELPAMPSPEEWDAVRLLPEEEALLEEEIAPLRDIADPALRNAVIGRVVRARKLRRWRLERGWRACPSCKALHDTDGEICPICRVYGLE